MATNTAPPQKINSYQINMLARQAILNVAQPMLQSVYNQTVVPANISTLNIQPSYVGLIRRFLVVITGTIKNNDTVNALTLTSHGLSNILSPNSGIVLTDLTNYQRINTGGWHLSLANSARHRKPYASGFAVETDEMSSYGENYAVITAPATIAASGSANFRAVFDVPVSYSSRDLRGAIMANVVNATMNLALTFNPTPFVATGNNSLFAVMKGTANAVIQSATVQVYQDYLDQLPIGKNGIVTPLLDVSTAYELKNVAVPNITANVDNPYQYSNYRSFLSTIAIYDDDPATDTGRVAGTDVNYFSQQVANFTNLWKLDPFTQSQITRDILNTDLPAGCYLFDSRQKPIVTNQYGNQSLIINPSSATGAILYLGLEDFFELNLVNTAGSLAG